MILVIHVTGLSKRFEENAFSYLQLTHKIIDNILYNDEDIILEEDADDAFFFHRISRFKEKYPDKKVTDVFPSFLLRNYSIFVQPSSRLRSMPLREIKAENIGALLKVRGIVTRISQVKPSVRVATYICESCGTETYQQIETDSFDLLEECTSEKCRIRNIKGTLCLVTRGSKFLKFQTLQLQELASDVPHGCIPRMMNVECYSS